MISKELINLIKEEFVLDWLGIHGVTHWARVRINGLKLAQITGAKTEIVELFAFLHDAKRKNDGYDKIHGLRAAEFIHQINDSYLFLNENDLDLLTYACTHHSEGKLTGDITVQTCWDADRLDLGRIGKKPNPLYLCTDAAKSIEMIEWAFQRSQLN
jgi:uncharacterized protein